MTLQRKKTSTVTKRPRNLLIELGTEELPPKALGKLAKSFSSNIHQYLAEAGVVGEEQTCCKTYAAPRRLAVWLKNVHPRQADRVEERRGPAIQAAYDQDGNPTKAALGFAGSCGVATEKLERLSTDKGEWLVFRQRVNGLKLAELVNQALEEAVRKLPIPKRMRWGDSAREFVRPVHWLLSMYGSDPLRVTVLGLKSGAWSMGHRFHAPGKIKILSADRYLATMKKQGFVMADYVERRTLIEKQAQRLAQKAGGNLQIEPDLLDEVTGLVEWPQALYGNFDQRFLEVPDEVLVSSMRDHQKYFHLRDDKGKLMPGFITVSNIKSSSPKSVRSGNERVLRARLADAEFFWTSDQKQPLASSMPLLKKVLFHNKLGSVAEKSQRIKILSEWLADQFGASKLDTNRASDLCKVDLVTDMVGEFPDLQGAIGSYYAALQGESKHVSDAIREHYLPRYSGDQLPSGKVSSCIALADRVDSLAGIFSSGEIPTGDKDPFALRRAALGVLRIIIEGKNNLDLYDFLERALILFEQSNLPGLNTSKESLDQVFDFVNERLKAYYQPLGFDSNEIASVMSVRPKRPLDFHHRLVAIKAFFSGQTEAAQSLAAANKRIANILAKQKLQGDEQVDVGLFTIKAESDLYDKVKTRGEKAQKYFDAGNYDKGLKELSALKKPVDTFFDQVMVMDEDPAVRSNRLALLGGIRKLFLQVADISVMRIE